MKCRTGIIPPKSSHLYPVPSLRSVPGSWLSFPSAAGAATSRMSFRLDKRWRRGNAALRGQQPGEKRAQSSDISDKLPLPSPERKRKSCLLVYTALFLLAQLPSPHLLPPAHRRWNVGRIVFRAKLSESNSNAWKISPLMEWKRVVFHKNQSYTAHIPCVNAMEHKNYIGSKVVSSASRVPPSQV